MTKVKAIKPSKPVSSLTSHAATIKAKFARLKAVKAEIGKIKALFHEHDLLMEQLLPLAIEVTPDQIIINRSYTIGSETHRFTPSFLDEVKGILVSKNWKSVCTSAFSVD